MTDSSEQRGLTSGNEESQHGPGADELKNEAILGGYLTRLSYIHSLDKITPKENTTGGPWDNYDTGKNS